MGRYRSNHEMFTIWGILLPLMGLGAFIFSPEPNVGGFLFACLLGLVCWALRSLCTNPQKDKQAVIDLDIDTDIDLDRTAGDLTVGDDGITVNVLPYSDWFVKWSEIAEIHMRRTVEIRYGGKYNRYETVYEDYDSLIDVKLNWGREGIEKEVLLYIYVSRPGDPRPAPHMINCTRLNMGAYSLASLVFTKFHEITKARREGAAAAAAEGAGTDDAICLDGLRGAAGEEDAFEVTAAPIPSGENSLLAQVSRFYNKGANKLPPTDY